MTDPDDLTTRAASYAVGAMTAAERRELEQELRRSPRLAAEVDEFTETAALLGLAAAPVAPSSSLRASILDAVDAAPQTSNVVRGPWFRRPVAAVIGAAAAIVLIAGGATVAVQLTREPSMVEQITAAADYERVVGDVTGGGSVTAVWSESLGRAVILVDDMAVLPADRVYQAWFIDEAGHAEPNATFGTSGSQTLTVDLTGHLDTGDAIGITIEPAGGSDAPTTTPIVVIPTA
ncbi:anti-sigma factor domain-containing protein [Pseudolysinimonas sp.]|uniref:anti-sigma factor n=1 Tax=Pseudolysinimonas sp. TaxID=2680009 RepID=UPI0037848ADE